jgi:hypothetical protein
MKRHLLALTFLLTLALPTAASSQFASGFSPNPPWCPTCFIASHMDSHTPGVTPVSESDLVWGWASLCQNGETPNMMTAVANTSYGQVAIDIGYAQHFERPDVDAHLQANGCAGNPTAGFAVWFYGWPVGTQSVTIIIHRQSIVAYHNFPVQP